MGRRIVADHDGLGNQSSLLWSVISNPRAVLETFHTIFTTSAEEDETSAAGYSTVDAELHAGLMPLDKNGERIESLLRKWSREILPLKLSKSTFADILEKRRIVLQQLLQKNHTNVSNVSEPRSLSVDPNSAENTPQLRPSSWLKVPGSDPATWPNQLDSFIEEIADFEILHLRNEPDSIAENFFDQALKSFNRCDHCEDFAIRKRILIGCIAFMGLHGSLFCLLKVLKLLLDFEQQHGAVSLPSLPSCIKALQSFQCEFDLPLPWTRSILGQWSEPITGSKRDNLKGKGLATDGTYLYIHNGHTLYKIGSGFNGSVQGQVYAMHKGYRSRESVVLAFADSILVALSNHCEWPFSDVIDTSDLSVSGVLQFGVHPDFDTPEKKADHIPLVLSDGVFLYFIDCESGATAKADNTPEDKTSSNERLVLYIYSLEQKAPDAFEKPRMSHHTDPKNLASILWRTMSYRYSLSQCSIALKSSKNDPNAAAKWLISHGALLSSPKVAHLVSRISLRPPEPIPFSLLTRSLVYTTGLHLVIAVPPYTADHNDSSDWAAQVFSMTTGELVARRCGLISAIGQIGCYDAANDVIWNCHFPGAIHFQFYRNHGPRRFPSTIDPILQKVTLESMIADVSSISRPSCLDLSVFLVAHSLRLLKQRNIAEEVAAGSLPSKIQLMENELKLQSESGNEHSKTKRRLRRKINRVRKQCIALRMSSMTPSSVSIPFCFSLNEQTFIDLLYLAQSFSEFLFKASTDNAHKYVFLLIAALHLLRAHFDEMESFASSSSKVSYKHFSEISDFLQFLLTKDFPKPYNAEIKVEVGKTLTSGFRVLFPKKKLQKDFILQTFKKLSKSAEIELVHFVKLILDWMADHIDWFDFLWTDICTDYKSRSISEFIFSFCLENFHSDIIRSAIEVVIVIVQTLISQTSVFSSSSPPSPSDKFYEWIFAFSELFIDRICSYMESHSAGILSSAVHSSSCHSILVGLRCLLPCAVNVLFLVDVPPKMCISMLSSLSKLALAFDKSNAQSTALQQEADAFVDKVSTEISLRVSVESSHPYSVGSNVIRETVFFRNCDAISITFDPRCCSKDHMDQLTLYTDASMNCRAPVGPFFGNEQDKNSNWPHHPIIVFGSTLSLSFSAKSQPRAEDRNRWGFKCILRGLSFNHLSDPLDIECDLCATAGVLFSNLVRGAPVSQDEIVADSCFKRSFICQGLEKSVVDQGDEATVKSIRDRCGIVEQPSAAEPLFRSIVEGTMSPVLSQLQKHEYRFIGSHIIQKQSTLIQTEWQKCIRSVMACMIKHSGLTPEIMQFLRSGGRIESSSEHAFVTLQEKLGVVSISAQKLQDWMLQQVQAGKRWQHLCSSPTITLSSLEEEFGNPEHFSTLISVCHYAGIEYSLLSRENWDLLTVLKALIQKHNERKDSSKRLSYPCPYRHICKHVQDMCEQLLLFRGPFNSDRSDSGIDVPDMWRSRSVASNLNDLIQSPIFRTHSVPAINNTRDSVIEQSDKLALKGFESRIHNFQHVLQTYQHWKAWQKIVTPSRSATSEQVLPFEAVLDIIKRRFPATMLSNIAHIQERRSIYRIAALREVSHLLQNLTTSTSKLAIIGKLATSLQSADRPSSLNFGISCCNSALSLELLNAYELYFKTISSVLIPGPHMGILQMHAIKDLFDFEFGVEHCNLIEKCSTLQLACDLLLNLSVDPAVRVKQRLLMQSLWSGFRLLAFRILKLGANDVLSHVLLPDVLMDLKRLQRLVFQLIFRLLHHFSDASGSGTDLIYVNRSLEKILSFLVVCSGFSSISLLNRNDFLQTFSVIIHYPCRFSLRCTRLAIRLSQVVLPLVAPASTIPFFPSSLPAIIISTISDLIINNSFKATKSSANYCVVVHRSDEIDQSRWVEILSNELPDLVLGRPPADDPTSLLADEMHKDLATKEFQSRSRHRTGPAIVPLKEIGGGSIQFLSDNAIVCKDGFATVIGEVAINAGKWYFEIHLQSAGVMQIGWSTLDIAASSSAGNGIGDDKKSWAYDGRRLSKWHGEQSRYSNKRWQSGDVVGVAIDLDDRLMRYYLNGEDLGVAFSGFDLSESPNSAVRPSCSFASGERARFVFNAAQFRCSLPANHYPLQGDKPMPKNNPIGRAHSIMCDLSQLGLTMVWQDSHQGCCDMASKLASRNVIVTVMNQDAFDSMPSADPPDYAASEASQTFIFSGHQALAAASEYVSLSRFLLKSSVSSKAWADSMSSLIASILDDFCSHHQNSQSRLRQVLGAICILGGFSEPLRVGCLADVLEGDSVEHHCVVLDYSPGSSFAQIAMLRLSALQDPNFCFTSAYDLSSDGSTQTSQLVHRVRVDRLRTRPIVEVDLKTDFPISKSNVSCLMSLMDPHDNSRPASSLAPFDRWLALELGVRSGFVLEALLRTSARADPSAVRLATKHFVHLARNSNWRNFEFDRVRNVFERARDRVWDLSSEALGWFALPRFGRESKTSAFVQLTLSPTVSLNDLRRHQFVYGSSAYLQESSGSLVEDTSIQRMVRYWELKIIPIIQDYVRGSFRDYEMVYFFEQLRQPLRAGDAVSAMKIVYTLCNQRIPDSVQFPALNRDWSELICDDISIGQALIVSASIRCFPAFWNEQLMQHIIGCAGIVQAIRFDKDLVLLQLFFEDRSVLESFWFPVSSLREPDRLDSSCSTENIDNIRRIDDAVDFLESAIAPLPVLLARRSIISLCSQSSSFVQDQLGKSSDLGSLLFASLSQCLQSTLNSAGVPFHEHAETIANFERCLMVAISDVSEAIGSKILEISERSLSKAAEFSLSNTIICEQASSREFFVSGTSSFVIQFDLESSLPPNSSFSIYADSECTRLIKCYSGGKSGVSNLQHCLISGDRFWTHVTLPADGTPISKFCFRATALSPDFALSFWIVRFLTQKEFPCLGKTRSEMVFEFIQQIFVQFNLISMDASPMKETILFLIYDLIQSLQPQITSSKTNSSRDQFLSSLDYIARLQPELIRVLASESLSGNFTSYLQLLLDLQITADCLRPPSCRLAEKFDPVADLAVSEEVRVESSDGSWSCSICTLVNESSVYVCAACEGPRPPPEQNTRAPTTTNDLSPNSRDRVLTRATSIFNSICGLVDIMQWFCGRSELISSNAVRTIVEMSWNKARSESLEPQLFIINGIPLTADDNDALARLHTLIAELSSKSDIPFLVQQESVFVGTNRDGPLTPSLEDAAEFSSSQPSTLKFIPEHPMDENGLIWYLGTKGNSEPFTNPMIAGLVTVRPSSLQHDSVGPEAVVGREAVRCVSTSAEHQWFEIDLHQTRICPSHYTVRHYISWHTEALRNWRFEAFAADEIWICLHEAVSDESLSAKGAAATFPVTPRNEYYSRFRVLMTGENSNRHWYLALSGFEIYGEVMSDTIQRKLPIRPSNRFAVISLLNVSDDCVEAFMKCLDGVVVDWPGSFRSRLSVERFDDVSRLDNRVISFVRSRLIQNNGSLSPAFSRAIHDLLKIPAAFNDVFPDVQSDLGQFLHNEIGEGVIDAALLENILQRAVSSDSRVFQIWDWLKALGYNLDIALIVETSFEKALLDSSAWSSLPDSAHENFIDHLYSIADRIACTDILQLPLNRITCSESELLDARKLIPISEASIRLRFAVLKEFNESIKDLLPLADLRCCDGNRLGALLRRCRRFIFRSVKQDFLIRISDLTAETAKRPPILSFNRLELASRDQENRDFIHDTFFGNAYLQLRDLPSSDLKPARPHGTDPFLAFEVVFHGEDVVGEGGPYRQFFSDISCEVLAPDSPLFIPCPNQQGGVGENQDAFVIRPSAATSSSTLSLFEFFGQILGICLRTGVRISLRLPAFTWKPIVLDPILPHDLSSIDHQTSMVLQLMQSIDEELFADMIDETFSTPLSDRTVALLRRDGDKERVTFAERYEYIRLVHNARFNEAQAQIDAIRRGIHKIIPVQLLNLFLHTELELLVNGKQIIDVNLLRRHTKYSGVSADAPHIRYFWEVLTEFSQQDRRKFIRFAWAQERLPVDDAEFVRTHTRLLIKTTVSDVAADCRFPRADTCFFNLELPAYSNKEILHKRLLFAITHTDSMNADVVPDDQLPARHHGAPDFSNLMP